MASVALAFGASLLSLLSGFPWHPVLGAAVLVPVAALALAAGVAMRGGDTGPDIHDRYLDYIVGLGLLGLSTAVMLFLPGALSIFFWSWRLDLLVVPFFVAGSLALLGGSRALWRFRIPLGFLLLAWPLPYLAAGVAHSAWTAAALTALALGALLAIWLGRRRAAERRPGPQSGSARRPGGGLLAAGVVLVAAGLTALGDQGLGPATRLLRDDGS
ncbi:MAG TPA: hypothetical protein VET26_03170, partial [Candidatus Sulfotelmatobacter sp.]|nr:hypothetical protein [Candidatus Sulfotelmatobacter sp.]